MTRSRPIASGRVGIGLRLPHEEFGKQVVTVTTSRGSEKMELLLSTVVQACSPPPPDRAVNTIAY